MQINKQSFFNLSLRGLSMGARFLLIFCLGKYFSIEDLGLYGIFYTTVTLGILALGLDFYTFSNREILYAKNEDKLSILRNQLLFYGLTYVCFLLPMLLIFFYDVLPFKFICFFYVILVLEHLSQEFYRIFIILSYPIFANWLLFLRTAIWVFLLIVAYAIMQYNNYSLAPIFIGWIIGAGLSVLLGFIRIIKLFKGYSLKPIQLNWFISGIKVCSFYFFSTIALKIIESSNRYMIEYWCDLKSVGIFVFYSQIANMINVVIFTLFLMVIYPKLIIAVNDKNIIEFNHLKSYIMKKVLIYSISLGLVLAALIYPILFFINKNEYFYEIVTFYILVVSNIFLNISLVYHYILYAFKKDFSLFISTTIGAISSLIFNVILIKKFGIAGAATSLLLSYMILTISKAIYSKMAEANFE
ncbi:MAG: polysaccharide biosynthesis C-terminal domain-containing protein [Bacteroidia bacterium]|nr:polysaccharide biosynthesis C-terminal domain-containing protein [Bacteroidia bacterium]